jgi:alpha-tubulin suppressor-like RCC1 family protein
MEWSRSPPAGGHSCALITTGQVRCWGSNTFGALGNGTTTDSTSPVDAKALSGQVTAIAANGSDSCALLSTGGVGCWGINDAGQLGNGTTTGSSTPVGVSGLPIGVIAIDVGGRHVCALVTGGVVKCWGTGQSGQLGNGKSKDSPVPVDVVGLTGISAIAAGGNYQTCALTNGGGVKCWGYNVWGQVGDGTTDSRSPPVDVSGLAAGVTAITAHGYEHACALTDAGGVKCWGGNEAGELGNGTTNDSHIPVDVLEP